MKITGLQNMKFKMNNAQKLIGRHLERGLMRAGIYLLKESKKIIPVQIGNLKASGGTRKFGHGLLTDVIIYYTAPYAAFVHEIPNPPVAHGSEFNKKHAEEITRAGTYKSSLSSKSASWKPRQKKGKAENGMFPRGENQQFKFIEKPAKMNRAKLLKIISKG